MRPRLVKLVRDRVGQFLGDTTVSYDRVAEVDYGRLLEDKLLEETVEYIRDPSLAELADVYEVVRALAEHRHHNLGTVASEAAAKRQERGGFSQGVGMWVQTTAPARFEPAGPPERKGEL